MQDEHGTTPRDAMRLDLAAALAESAARLLRDEPIDARALRRDILAWAKAEQMSESGPRAPESAGKPQGQGSPQESPRAARREAARRIFEHWRRTMGKERARLTPERAQKLMARLRDGYTEADIVRAIDGCANSPFHMGENEHGRAYNDLVLICRDGSKLEQFMEMAPDKALEQPVLREPEQQSGPKAEAKRLAALAKRKLREGDVAAHNELMARARKAMERARKESEA